MHGKGNKSHRKAIFDWLVQDEVKEYISSCSWGVQQSHVSLSQSARERRRVPATRTTPLCLNPTNLKPPLSVLFLLKQSHGSCLGSYWNDQWPVHCEDMHFECTAVGAVRMVDPLTHLRTVLGCGRYCGSPFPPACAAETSLIFWLSFISVSCVLSTFRWLYERAVPSLYLENEKHLWNAHLAFVSLLHRRYLIQIWICIILW